MSPTKPREAEGGNTSPNEPHQALTATGDGDPREALLTAGGDLSLGARHEVLSAEGTDLNSGDSLPATGVDMNLGEPLPVTDRVSSSESRELLPAAGGGVSPGEPLPVAGGVSSGESREVLPALGDDEPCEVLPAADGDVSRGESLPATGGGLNPGEPCEVLPAGGGGVRPGEALPLAGDGASSGESREVPSAVDGHLSLGESLPAAGGDMNLGEPLPVAGGVSSGESREVLPATGGEVSPGEPVPVAGGGVSSGEALPAADDDVSRGESLPTAGGGLNPDEPCEVLPAAGGRVGPGEPREVTPVARGGTNPDELRRARAYLLRVAEPPAPALVAFVAHHGPIAAAARVRRGDCPPEVLKATEARRQFDLVGQDFARAAAAGARLVVPEDDEWPAWPLLSLDQATQRGVTEAAPPLALWVCGEVALGTAADRAVAVVGARAATEYGEHHAAELSYGLASRGVPVFSGAAYGIDGAAHRGALAAGGVTVAVLGCAVDGGYPAGHVGLLNRIVRNGGAVVSEYPPGTPPARHRFLVRNRLIAALTEGTLVVEAGRRSGARNTASTAGALGKVVMAVPGPISSGMSVGCHELIRDARATLVSTVDEVLETVGRFGIAEDPAARPKRPTDRLGPEALRAYEALAVRADRSDGEIAAESGLPLRKVRALLPALEIDGFAVRGETGWRRRKESA